MMTKTIEFRIEKQTKGAIRYTEQNIGEFDEPTVGTLYVRKSAFRELGRIPEALTLTIEAK